MLTKESVLGHPHLNPAFAGQMSDRLSAQSFNRSRVGQVAPIRVPKQPNRYLPHIGAKEMARHEGSISLGPNASRALEERAMLRARLRPHQREIVEASRRIISTGEEALAGIADFSKGAEDAAPVHKMIGETVTWTSSNLEKTGEIVAVVPAGQHPSTDLTPKVKEPGAPRDHDSYVVKANGKHYWPRVTLLSIGGA